MDNKSVFENKQSISNIVIKHSVSCWCPLGKADYTNQFTAYIELNKNSVDFLAIEKFINEMKGKELIIEDAVNNLYEYLYDLYKPKNLIVSSKVDDAAHFPVIITKKMK